MTETTVRPPWGSPDVIDPKAIAAWGARLIVTQDGEVDLVPDRQGTAAAEEQHTHELLGKLNNEFTIPELRRTIGDLLRSYEMETRTAADFILFQDDRMVVHANTRGSAGYCYVTAWLYPERPRTVAYASMELMAPNGVDNMVALVEEDEPGYYATTWTGSLEYCEAVAQSVNDSKGYDRDTVLKVVSSSMRKGTIR